jgi:hypothetical protein
MQMLQSPAVLSSGSRSCPRCQSRWCPSWPTGGMGPQVQTIVVVHRYHPRRRHHHRRHRHQNLHCHCLCPNHSWSKGGPAQPESGTGKGRKKATNEAPLVAAVLSTSYCCGSLHRVKALQNTGAFSCKLHFCQRVKRRGSGKWEQGLGKQCTHHGAAGLACPHRREKSATLRNRVWTWSS